MEEFKPNSHKAKEEKKLEKVTSGKVGKRKKSAAVKLAEIFIPEDISDVRDYIVDSVVVPLIKKAIEDAVHIVLHGEAPAKKSGSSVSYSGYYDDKRKSSPSVKPVHYEDITFSDRSDAQETLTMLDELVECYGVVSVADLYDIVGLQTGRHTDNRFGWTDVSAFRIVRTWDGEYMLKMPKAVPIN